MLLTRHTNEAKIALPGCDSRGVKSSQAVSGRHVFINRIISL